MLYDRINLEQYNEVASAAFGCLDKAIGEWLNVHVLFKLHKKLQLMLHLIVNFNIWDNAVSETSFRLHLRPPHRHFHNPSSGDAGCRDVLQGSPPFDHFPIHLAALSAFTMHALAVNPPSASSFTAAAPPSQALLEVS